MQRSAKPPKPRTAGREQAAYRDDLAYIHDTGYGAFAADAAPWLLSLFRERGLGDGLVIDLGCGSGIWARALTLAGYGVLGFDISEAMVALASRRAPHGEFRQQSFLKAPLRPCVAVTALGEIFNYQFDRGNTPARLHETFGRVFKALRPGGLFVFDVAAPGRVPGGHRRTYSEGSDWACLVEAVEDADRQTLTRRITSFRKVGNTYRRDHEIHHLRLYDREELMAALGQIGFRVKAVRAYGETRFPPGYFGLVAQKP